VDRLRRWVSEGVDIFKALGGDAAAWKACLKRGAIPRQLDLVLEHLEVLAHAKESAAAVGVCPGPFRPVARQADLVTIA
jgi:hypothetical protein